MGPLQHDSRQSSEQARRPRKRRCLLKGCGQRFQPGHPLSRYCSPACRQAAVRWSRWCAAQRYRHTETGRAARREQSRRYRQRATERKRAAQVAQVTQDAPGEGHQDPQAEQKIPCSRPGCYETFCPSRRSPLQRFCSRLCRQALQRVLRREARWVKRHRPARGTVMHHPHRRPPPAPS